MNQLRTSLLKQNITDISFKIINKKTSHTNLERLSSLAGEIPVFQEQQDEHIWKKMQADVDHVYIFNRCGKLTEHFTFPWSMVNYPYVKQAILSADKNSTCGSCELPISTNNSNQDNTTEIISKVKRDLNSVIWPDFDNRYNNVNTIKHHHDNNYINNKTKKKEEEMVKIVNNNVREENKSKLNSEILDEDKLQRYFFTRKNNKIIIKNNNNHDSSSGYVKLLPSELLIKNQNTQIEKDMIKYNDIRIKRPNEIRQNEQNNQGKINHVKKGTFLLTLKKINSKADDLIFQEEKKSLNNTFNNNVGKSRKRVLIGF
ncbi:uncharacterized protein LOC142328629 [Lycorma delicatula]|uniref:uncharacterized protein LOC142328629 n=1 Tax=Lycorma delicatula TaxID=130591 RepID=UPI003F510967